jgi:FtsH-binding integral membrane protein
MARIAHDRPRAAVAGAAPGAATPSGDDYLAKVVKLIPAEVIATYTAIFNLIPSLTKPSPHTCYWINVIVFWVATPVVLWLIGKKEGKLPSPAHFIISTIAFGVWAYAVSGNLVLGDAFQSALAGIILLLFTFVVGFVPLT